MMFRYVVSVIVLSVVVTLLWNTFAVPRSSCRQVGLTVSPKDVASWQGIADDCFNVFLDVGSNIGVHGRFLFEPEKYPKARVAREKFQKTFGNTSTRRSNTCVFAFEPNPSHKEHQLLTQTSYAAMGWRYHYIPMGVGTRNATLNFYKNRDVGKGARREEWGFSTIKRGKADERIEVAVLDLSEWLQRLFRRRLPPADPSWGQPKVLMKMDVEGMEVSLIPHLLIKGVLCNVYMFGELHGFGPYELANGIVIPNMEVRAWVENINRILLADGCPAVFEFLDDESYVHDGMPYPSPP
mmetsp:Transcript_59367/g.141536  ORF Transcript_59367/g.141536 Transcript_59367/m.141536 type:complete len:296 (+) Transcript_59367:92-979(+)